MRIRNSHREIALGLVLLCGGAALASCGVKGSASGKPAGAAGTSGAGTSGQTSAAGTSGDGGDTGSGGTGSAGTSAAAGASGVAGVTGAAGTSGGAGSVGAAGTSGSAGSSGAAGSVAASGITIKIGTVDVPKENAIAFIHFGHSNMAGRARTPATTRPYFFMETDPHAWMYHSATKVPYANGAKAGWELAIEPKTAGDMGNFRTPDVNGGLGTALVKEAVAAAAPNNYFISLGYGIASAYCTQFLPGALYYDDVVAAAKELKGKVTFGAIVIYLGITERHGTTADVQNFPNCINQIVTAIRTDIGEPNLPVMISGYEMGATRNLAPTTAFAQAIIPRIALIPTIVSTSAVIPTDNPIIPIEPNEPDEPDGDHHFTFDGHKEFASRVIQTMKDKGWWHW
jgi:Carbohydrate esterase, sialic acid-specific acetylesterase